MLSPIKDFVIGEETRVFFAKSVFIPITHIPVAVVNVGKVVVA